MKDMNGSSFKLISDKKKQTNVWTLVILKNILKPNKQRQKEKLKLSGLTLFCPLYVDIKYY